MDYSEMRGADKNLSVTVDKECGGGGFEQLTPLVRDKQVKEQKRK